MAETVIRELSVNSQRGYFTEASGESPGTVAGIVSQPVHAPTTIQAGVRLTVVQVQRTILPRVARCTLAAVICVQINASSTILTKVVISDTVSDFLLTHLACVTWTTLTGVTLHKVNAGTIVHTGMAFTVVNVCFTSVTLEPIVTLASESSVVQNFTSTIKTRIDEAGVDFVLTLVSVESCRTFTGVVLEVHALTGSSVLAGLSLTGITFSHHLRIRGSITHKERGLRGQQELVEHGGGAYTGSDAGLHVVLLDPVREPLQVTVTVQLVTSQGQVS